jgi:hypothetical protein
MDSTEGDTVLQASLPTGVTYHWFVRGGNSAGFGPNGDTWDLYLAIPKPSRVVLTSPEDGALVGGSIVTFKWNSAGSDVTGYWFELATDSAFSSQLWGKNLTTTEYVRQGFVNGTYWWRVRAGNMGGAGEFSESRKLTVLITGVNLPDEIPTEYSLSQNYPNPFNPATTLRFGLPENAYVRLLVYNTLGQEVARVLDEEREAGYHEVVFDARMLSSGVYYYRMQAGGYTQTKRLLLLR